MRGTAHSFQIKWALPKNVFEIVFPWCVQTKEILFIVRSIALRPFLQCILMNMINIYGKTPEIYEAKSVNDDLFGPF